MRFSGARIIALDVGERRIGVAVSDPLGLSAQGLSTVQRSNLAADLERLKDLAHTYNAQAWLLGLPLHMSGSEGRQAGKIRAFGRKIHAATHLPVEYWDERLTTVEATRVLRSAALSREKSRQAVDRLSAVILLQSYLDRHVSLPNADELQG